MSAFWGTAEVARTFQDRETALARVRIFDPVELDLRA
jgi:hypothetical protein